MTITMVALSGFFAVLSFVLLVRYRQVSQQISASSDLGRALWQALESRLKRQDERILDMMGKFEVIQSRALLGGLNREAELVPAPPPQAVSRDKEVGGGAPVVSTGVVSTSLDQTEKAVLTLLKERSRTSVEIKEIVGKSREHTARLMKSLFDRKLVSRDDSKKPFVYQLTDEGRNYLSAS